METTNPLLNQLKDIHLPAAPGIWPLALGWYAIIALFVGGLLLAGYGAVKHYRTNRYRVSALAELAQLEADLNRSQNIQQAVENIAILLKRTALAAYPRQQVAGLTGEAWLVFLDKTSGMTVFTQGIGRILLAAPYQATANIPIQELLQLCREWIARHKKRGNHSE